jgi:hypothetical protein
MYQKGLLINLPVYHNYPLRASNKDYKSKNQGKIKLINLEIWHMNAKASQIDKFIWLVKV